MVEEVVVVVVVVVVVLVVVVVVVVVVVEGGMAFMCGSSCVPVVRFAGVLVQPPSYLVSLR